MRLHHLLPIKHFLHKNLEPPIRKPRHRMLHQYIPQLTLITIIPTPQTTPLEPNPLFKKRADIHSLSKLRAAHGPKSDDPAIPRRRIQVPLEITRAHEINDDVDAPAVRRFEDLFGPILRVVVETRRGAEFFRAEIDFRVAPRGDVDGGGGVGFGELDPRDRDRGGACVPQDRFAWRELADEIECLGRGYPRLAKISVF